MMPRLSTAICPFENASDAGGELYVMEQFLDYRMVEDRSVVEHVHEVQALAKELENYRKEAPCVLPNKFVAGAIITKLPHSLRDFATSLKHKRKEFTFDDLDTIRFVAT
jgi:hypothetical protein